MKWLLKNGESLTTNISDLPPFDDYSRSNPGNVIDCPNLVIEAGQTVGMAAFGHSCNCMCCRILRTASVLRIPESLTEFDRMPPLQA